MGLLDPIVCRQARELIQAGKLVEAVRLLTASPDREHRAARRLLLELHDRLVSQAAELLKGGSLEAAWQAIEHAAQCGNLEGQALDLRLQIAARLEEARRKQQWNAQRLEEARRLADAGHMRTALGKLTPVEHPEAHLLRLDIEERLCRFERYLQQAGKLIDDNQPQLARPILQKAARILPHDPALLRLLQQCPEVPQPLIATPPAPTGQPTCWAFGSWAWVVLGCEVVLGRAGQSGVHVPLSGGLRRRHALVIRDAGHYRLVPCLDSRSTPCPVRVNDQPVEQPVLLRDRDRLVLGEPGCTLIFRLPVGQSSTAVLQSPPGEPPPVHTADGDRFACVVLLDRQMLVRPCPPAHLVLPQLPCRLLRWQWDGSRLELSAEGGMLICDELDAQALGCRQAAPGRWVLQGELDEAELLGRAAAGLEPNAQLSFHLRAQQ